MRRRGLRLIRRFAKQKRSPHENCQPVSSSGEAERSEAAENTRMRTVESLALSEIPSSCSGTKAWTEEGKAVHATCESNQQRLNRPVSAPAFASSAAAGRCGTRPGRTGCARPTPARARASPPPRGPCLAAGESGQGCPEVSFLRTNFATRLFLSASLARCWKYFWKRTGN